MSELFKLILSAALLCWAVIFCWMASELMQINEVQRDQIRELSVMNDKLMNSNDVLGSKLNEYIQESK